jgi:outer membrane murein-binding lipoprotein Lpp
MAKYKNIKEFVQPVNIEGKRLFIRPGQIFQTSKVLDLSYFPFLELVADDVQLTAGITAAPEKPKMVSDDSVKSLRAEVDRLTKMMSEMAVNNESDEAEKAVNERLDTIERRMGVLKTAVETVNAAVSNLEQEVYFNNNFVVVVDDEEKK